MNAIGDAEGAIVKAAAKADITLDEATQAITEFRALLPLAAQVLTNLVTITGTGSRWISEKLK